MIQIELIIMSHAANVVSAWKVINISEMKDVMAATDETIKYLKP